MKQGRFVFSQLCDYLPHRVFDRIVSTYDGNKYVKHFTCWNQLLVMMFGQLSNRDSLRDLITCLHAHQPKFLHLGFGANVTRSNLAKANEQREPRIFEDFANYMISQAREKRAKKDFFVDGNVYAFDSSTISLCLNVFWWAKFRQNKAGVKLHTLYDARTDIPAFNLITEAKVADPAIMGLIPYESGSYYVFDRAYVDMKYLYLIHKINAFFVVREKRAMRFELAEDHQYNNPKTGIMADWEIRLTGQHTKKEYPDTLRRIVYYEKEHNRTFVYYTNKMDISAEDAALLYRYRWRVELFFKWMKQHLRIKSFWGTTESAVKTQIYIAIISCCVVALIEKELKLGWSTYDVLRIISLSLLDKTPLAYLFTDRHNSESNYQNDTQLKLNFF
jgi:transposase